MAWRNSSPYFPIVIHCPEMHLGSHYSRKNKDNGRHWSEEPRGLEEIEAFSPSGTRTKKYGRDSPILICLMWRRYIMLNRMLHS